MFCETHIQKLIQIESGVHYSTPPPNCRKPYVIIERNSRVLLSAPHGAITCRNKVGHLWHEEEEYTAGIALFLAEYFDVSVIATTWKTADSDPNNHHEKDSPYKGEVRRLVEKNNIGYVIDLHGASGSTDKIKTHHLVDIGTRKHYQSLRPELSQKLIERININLGLDDAVGENGYAAMAINDSMTITAFCHHVLGIESVQIEMRPSVRIPISRIDSSAYSKGEFHPPKPDLVLGMMHALGEFINHLKKK